MTPITLGFGGGCHWCTEAVFQAIGGVLTVRQGFIASVSPHDAFSEAVLIEFDANVIALADLVEIHLRTHASTSPHKMRGKYRSAVYVMDKAQATEVRDTLDRLHPDFDGPLVTQVLPFVTFRESEPRFRDYYAADPTRPFCRTYIDPKLAELRRRYADSAVKIGGPSRSDA